MNETIKLAEYIANLTYEDLPEEVCDMAVRCLYDYFGGCLFTTKTDMGKIITEFCRSDSNNSGNCIIMPDFNGKYSAVYAALANGTLGHGFELDDQHMATNFHPGGPIISAALAMAQERNASGKALITAIVCGYEAGSRIGLCLGSRHQDWGYHATASFGVFGAAAAAGKIVGLSAEAMAWAFGLSGSFASGVKQFAISGSMAKRIHGGKSAQQGILCAKLAEKGFTGPTDILEGQYGFLRLFRGKCPEDEIRFSYLTEGYGKHYTIMDTAVKPYSCCGVLHSTIEAIEDIKKEPGYALDQIDHIVVHSHHNMLQSHMDYEPNSIAGAQYSEPFVGAMALLGDMGDPSPFLNEAILRDEKILHYAKLFTAKLDDELDSLFPDHFAVRIEMIMKDGTVYTRQVIDQKGHSKRPFSKEQIIGKFRTLAETVLTSDSTAILEKNIGIISEFDNINAMFEGITKNSIS